MGMFDYITVGTTLPELPEAIISHWGGKASDVVFQTKDTPNQSMSNYKIDDAGVLWVKKVDGHWVEGEPVADDAPFSKKMAAIGQFVIDKEWWEETNFTGAINFYESYNHPEYKSPDVDYDSDEWRKFVLGLVEYCALFSGGMLVDDIQLTAHTPPKKYTDEEYAAKQEEWKVDRKEWDERLKESRKRYPSAEQKLIDNIDRECKLTETIMDEEDVVKAISNIKIFIKEYREKYDRYFE